MNISPENNRVPPPTPGLSSKMIGLFLEEEECICGVHCEGDHHHHRAGDKQDGDHDGVGGDGDRDECLCSVQCEGISAHEDCYENGGVAPVLDECLCSVQCEGVAAHEGYYENGGVAPVLEEEDDWYKGIKYCPGIEPTLPRYSHIEYKPRSSKWKFQGYFPSRAGAEKAKEISGVEEKEGSGRSGEEKESEKVVFQEEGGVKTLIKNWEKRLEGGEGSEFLNLPDSNMNKRRVSQEFQETLRMFVEKEGGGREGRMPAKKMLSFANLDFQKLYNLDVANNVAARRKISFKNRSSFVRGGGTPLARVSANEKRKVFDEISGNVYKRFKGDREIMDLTTLDPGASPFVDLYK